ncbi:MAG: hypothetical protein ACRD1C_07825 [Terriglobales bacterium]
MNCPACEADMDLDEEQLQEGGVVHCEGCGAKHEVVNLHPLELERIDSAEDEDDDDEDDDDGFDDDDEDENDDGFDDDDDDLDEDEE